MRRLRRLEQRLRELEDRAEIFRLMASYGPSVDSGHGQAAAGLWTADGVYDTDVQVMAGPAAIAGMVAEDPHQHYIQNGSAHVPSIPAIDVRGDTAVAIGYSHLFLRAGDSFRVARASANRWEFVRTADGWRVQRRLTRLLSGSADARELLGEITGIGRRGRSNDTNEAHPVDDSEQ
jgi:SnoaL-like domain